VFKPLFKAKKAKAVSPRDPIQEAHHTLARRDRWLHASALTAMFLTTLAYAAMAIPFVEHQRLAAWQVRPEQGVTALLGLLLLFLAANSWQRGFILRERKQLMSAAEAAAGANAALDVPAGAETDPLTGLWTRKAAEDRVGRDLARAKRLGTPLSMLLVTLDDLPQISRRGGASAGNQVVQEFALQLKKATRGTDMPVRLAADEFAVILPECPTGSVQRVLGRLSPVVVKCSGEELTASYSTASIDYQPGEMPAQLFQRGEQMLRLYRTAGAEPGGSR